MLLANFNGKEHLQHRAVSLRQHGFLVKHVIGWKSVHWFFVVFFVKRPTRCKRMLNAKYFNSTLFRIRIRILFLSVRIPVAFVAESNLRFAADVCNLVKRLGMAWIVHPIHWSLLCSIVLRPLLGLHCCLHWLTQATFHTVVLKSLILSLSATSALR